MKTRIIYRNGIHFQVPLDNKSSRRYTVHAAGDGISWGDTETLDVNQPHGLDYRQLNHIAIAVRKRINHEHTVFADATVGGLHVPGKVALLDIVDQTIDISIADSTYHGRNLIYDQTNNVFWCFTNIDGTASTPAAFLLKTHPDRAWAGGDVTWTGAHEFSDVGVKGDFSVDGTAIFDATGTEFGGSAGISLFYDPTSYARAENSIRPDGMIMKSGKTATPTGELIGPTNFDVSFAVPFPTGAAFPLVVLKDNNKTGAYAWTVDDLNTLGFTVTFRRISSATANLDGFYWFVIGD